MDFSRINRTHIWIVGAVVILASCGIIIGVFIMGMRDTATIAGLYQAAMDAKADTLPSVTTATKTARDNLTADKALHTEFIIKNPQFYVDKGTTPVASERRLIALQQWEMELRGTTGNNGALKTLLEGPRGFGRRIPGVVVRATFNFPAPKTRPSQEFLNSPVPFVNAGHVDLVGSYTGIQRYLDSVSQMSRICTIGSVSLDSTIASVAIVPAMQNLVHASFSVTVYEFIQGLPEVPSGAPAAAGGAPGGGGYPAAGGGYPASGGAAPSGYPPAAGKAATTPAPTK